MANSASAGCQLGERLLDGRVQITSDVQGQVVTDDRSGLREGRAARASQRVVT